MHASTFSIAREDRYFEDYVVGSIYEFGAVTVTEEEIIDFARRYDPQWFHIDPEAAIDSQFGGLIASGWLTAGLMMRLMIDNFVSSVACLGSPGVKELKWIKPVRPGDTLSIRVSIQEARHSRSKPDRGLVGTCIEVLTQQREVVMTLQSVGIYLCRNNVMKPS